MGKKSTPTPPDYEAAAERTSEGNVALVDAQTQDNRPDQYTPWGASEWSEDAQGNWTQNISLTDAQQGALDDQQNITGARSDIAGGMLDRVGNEFGESMDWDQFGDYTRDIGTGDEARQSAIDSSYDQSTSRLDPRFEQKRSGQDAQLRAQGLRPGDEAYDTAMANLGREETDAYNQAMFSSIRHGGSEGSRVFNMNKEAAGFGNTVRQSEIAEEMQGRGFSLNEINALLSGQQIAMPGMPGFNSSERAAGADYTGAANSQWGADMDAQSMKNAQAQATMSGVTDLAGSAMMFSDIRLKRNVRLVGSYDGHNVYEFDYIWGQHAVGVMAHEMPEEYVSTHRSGYLMVDYGRLING